MTSKQTTRRHFYSIAEQTAKRSTIETGSI